MTQLLRKVISAKVDRPPLNEPPYKLINYILHLSYLHEGHLYLKVLKTSYQVLKKDILQVSCKMSHILFFHKLKSSLEIYCSSSLRCQQQHLKRRRGRLQLKVSCTIEKPKRPTHSFKVTLSGLKPMLTAMSFLWIYRG